MADQLPLTTDPNASAQAAAPPVVAAPAAPPAPRPRGTNATPPKPRPHQSGRRKGWTNVEGVNIPEAAFINRVRMEAARLLKKQTGMSLEEATEFIKSKGVVPAGGGQSSATNTATQALTELRRENDKLKKNNERMTRESAQKIKHFEKKLRNSNDARVEAELRADARMAGITDPDYAITLFARAVGKDGTLQPETFFAGLKATHAHLFVAAAPAPAPPKVVVAPTTTPPESQATGEVKPKAATAGEPVAEKHAEQDSPQEFAARQRSHGYVPGM